MDLAAYEAEARDAIGRSGDLEDLARARTHFLGRHSPLARELRAVRGREQGMALNALKRSLEEAVACRRAELERAAAAASAPAPLDVGQPGRVPALGRLHPITIARRDVEDVLLRLGYELRHDPEAETVEGNFGALRYPAHHPVRSPRLTYHLTSGAVLRTGTGPSVVHALRDADAPFQAASIGRCFHNIGRDTSHVDVFLQATAVAVGEGLAVADLKGTLEELTAELYGGAPEVRLAHAYNPFTAPSFDVSVPCPACRGGCPGCDGTGSLDLAAGMLRAELLQATGHDPECVSGFAFALGVEHDVARPLHRVGSPQALWFNDLRLLRRL